MSIRNRLLVSLLGLWITVWAAIAWVAFERSHHEVEEVLDAELAQMAHVLRSIAQSGKLAELELARQTLSPVGHPYETKISFQLWDGDSLISAFGAAPSTRLAKQLGYSDQEIAGTRWRVFGLPCQERGQVLYVAQDYSIRHELVQFLTRHALQPILWSLPLAVLLVWLAVTGGLAPLARLARDVAERSDRRLDPIGEEGLPAEIRPLIQAINRLMAQLRGTLAIERRFAADASHELRTPLAIIRTHAQVAQRAEDPLERNLALASVDRGVEQAARLVTQLLSLSRLGFESRQGDCEDASLVIAASDVAAERQQAAAVKSIRLDCHLPDRDSCPVGVSAAMLDVLIGNLVDNAIKYTAPGGRVTVDVVALPAGARLTVVDTGPGIPPEERERVFERFYRRSGGEQPGAGLGLSIVKRICDLHGATIRLSDAGAPSADSAAGPSALGGAGLGPVPLPGLRVEIEFQSQSSAAARHRPGAQARRDALSAARLP